MVLVNGYQKPATNGHHELHVYCNGPCCCATEEETHQQWMEGSESTGNIVRSDIGSRVFKTLLVSAERGLALCTATKSFEDA